MTEYPNIMLIPKDDLNFEVAEDCFVREFSIIVTKGSINDLTSSPRWLWWLIPPHGCSKKASIVHDFLIRSGKYANAYAHGVFYVLLMKDVKRWQAVLMFLAVVFFKKQHTI